MAAPSETYELDPRALKLDDWILEALVEGDDGVWRLPKSRAAELEETILSMLNRAEVIIAADAVLRLANTLDLDGNAAPAVRALVGVLGHPKLVEALAFWRDAAAMMIAEGLIPAPELEDGGQAEAADMIAAYNTLSLNQFAGTTRALPSQVGSARPAGTLSLDALGVPRRG